MSPKFKINYKFTLKNKFVYPLKLYVHHRPNCLLANAQNKWHTENVSERGQKSQLNYKKTIISKLLLKNLKIKMLFILETAR